MEAITIQKFIHRSPRKLRLIADMIRGTSPVRAMDVLKFTPNYAAKDISKALSTVLANAKQKGMNEQNIAFRSLEINEAVSMKRFRPGTRGRAKPYKKRMSHIKIILTDEIKLESKKISKSVNQIEVKGAETEVLKK